MRSEELEALRPVLKALGTDIVIYVPKGAYFSLTNSPYPTHILSSATDVYSKEPYMPCESGVVERVIKFQPPRFRVDANNYDYVILIKSRGYYLKILHVKPLVKVGDVLKLGDYLGNYLISGYFRPWSSKHMHVEVRRLDDPLRALGSIDLVPTDYLMNYLRSLRPCRDLRFKVVSNEGTYYSVEPIGCDVIHAELSSSCYGVLDGGMPHYGVGGVLIVNGELSSVGNELVLNGDVVGKALMINPRRSLVITLFSKGFRVGNYLVGLGTYLMSKYFKLVPLNGDVKLGIGEVIKLSTSEVKVKLPRWVSRLLGRG